MNMLLHCFSHHMYVYNVLFCLHVVFIFGPVFENACEFSVVKVAFFVDGSLSEQLVHIFICEAISHGGQQLPQVVFMNEACAGTKICV